MTRTSNRLNTARDAPPSAQVYSVKEIFYTLQGEGQQTGRPSVFCRFSGCNLWSGRPEHRASAICRFCDTDFVGTDGQNGNVFRSSEQLAETIAGQWPKQPKGLARYVVCTGGEPLLQLDPALIDALHQRGFEIAVETNGTLAAPPSLDWVCVSPKAGTQLMQRSGDELKLVFPQTGADPERYEHLPFRHFFLQPMDGPDRDRNTQTALRYCLEHPKWRLSLQTHKLLNIP